MPVWEISYLPLIHKKNSFLFKVVISKLMNIHNIERLHFQKQQSNGFRKILNIICEIQSYINAFNTINSLMYKSILKNKYIIGHQFLVNIHICSILKINSCQQRNTLMNNHALKPSAIWRM